MSSIPSSAMPHAKTHEHHDHASGDATKTSLPKTDADVPDATELAASSDKTSGSREDAVVEKAKAGVEEVRAIGLSRPSKGLAIGAAVVAGLAAAVAVPLVRARKGAKATPKRRSSPRKTAARKPAKAASA